MYESDDTATDATLDPYYQDPSWILVTMVGRHWYFVSLFVQTALAFSVSMYNFFIRTCDSCQAWQISIHVKDFLLKTSQPYVNEMNVYENLSCTCSVSGLLFEHWKVLTARLQDYRKPTVPLNNSTFMTK